jgi:hypothetical protein
MHACGKDAHACGGRARTPTKRGARMAVGEHACYCEGAHVSVEARTPVERAHTWVRESARRWRDAHTCRDRAHMLARGGAYGSWGAHTLGGGGGAHACGEGAHLGIGGAHGGGGSRTGVGRARTPVKRRAMVVEGAPRGKASICKRSFLFNYPQSEYIV